MLEQFDYLIPGLSKFELGFLVYFFLLFILWIWKVEANPSNNKGGSFFGRSPEYQMAVNKKRFVEEVVRWSLNHVKYEGIQNNKKKTVNLEISYYKHKKVYGIYSSYGNKIKVYVNAHNKIEEVVDTSIHEFVHWCQFRLDPRNFQSRYKKLMDVYSYEKHPMEIEARTIAAKHVKQCIAYLHSKGFIVKK
jgi:hypothetical protein